MANDIDDKYTITLPEGYNFIDKQLTKRRGFTIPNSGTYRVNSSNGWNYHTQAEYDWLQGTLPETKEEPIKCECGSSITLGKDDSWELHSDYCNCYKEKRIK